MKNTKNIFMVSIIVASFATCGIRSFAESAKVEKREFLAIDDGNHLLRYVNEYMPEKNWDVKTGYVMDMQLIGANRVLLPVNSGYMEFDINTGSKLKEWKGNGGKTHSIQRMSDGTTYIAGRNLNGKKGAIMIVIDENDKIINEVKFKGLKFLRHLRKTQKNTLIMAFANNIVETDLKGKILRKVA